MRFWKSHSLPSLINGYLVYSPQRSKISLINVLILIIKAIIFILIVFLFVLLTGINVNIMPLLWYGINHGNKFFILKFMLSICITLLSPLILTNNFLFSYDFIIFAPSSDYVHTDKILIRQILSRFPPEIQAKIGSYLTIPIVYTRADGRVSQKHFPFNLDER